MKNEIVLFENQDVKLEVNMQDETVWLNTEQMAQLFDRDYKTIRKHINNALKEELSDQVVVAKFENTTKHNAIERKNGQIIDNNTLVAITLLIAQSNPKEKNILIDLIMNFLNYNHEK